MKDHEKDGEDIRRTMEMFGQPQYMEALRSAATSRAGSRAQSRRTSRDFHRPMVVPTGSQFHSRHPSTENQHTAADDWIAPPQGSPPAAAATLSPSHERNRHGGSHVSHVEFVLPTDKRHSGLRSDTPAHPRAVLPTLQSYRVEPEDTTNRVPQVSSSQPAAATPFVVVDSLNSKVVSSFQRDHDEFEAILSIGGMTCAVCTGAVTRGLEELPFTKEININLLTNSGSVIFDGPKTNIDAIVEKVDDLGYDCSVEDCKLTKSSKRKSKVKRMSLAVNQLFDATLSIGGMTCAVCTGAVTRGLEEFSFVKSVDINLLTNSGQVRYEGPKERIDQIVEKVDDLGYDCSVEECKPFKGQSPVHGEKTVRVGPAMFRTTLSIGGMTCAVCTGAVTRGLEELPFVKEIDINLLTNSGVVVFETKDNLAAIVEKVDDLGYDCSVEDCIELLDDDEDDDSDLERTLMIKVLGFKSEADPNVIVEKLKETYPEKIEFEKQATLKDPIMKITYLPQAPYFTIRHILSTIVSMDESYAASIYHPPSLEEKSKIMHHKEQMRILHRLMLCVIIAIPTFIIGILYMSIVSPDNKIRQYMEQRMWVGQVSRTEWALLFLATPVFFYGADIFHKRAIKEIRALWKKGSTVPILRRFYRFGSMNLLMSTGTSIAYFASIAMLIMGATTRHQKMSGMGMGHTTTYFDGVVFLTMFILIGRYLEAYSKAKTGDAVTMLGKLRPTEALLVVTLPEDTNMGDNLPAESRMGGDTLRVNVDMLERGDIVKVPHGASPPADGKIVEGETRFDESSLTGEARPISKGLGDEVFSGTVNKGKAVSIKVTGIAGDSMLDQIVKVVREGQTKRAPVERVADIITGYFVPFITAVAIITWIVWLSLGEGGILPRSWLDVDQGGWAVWSLEFAIAVFVVACPCGIGLAAPTALFVGSGLAAQNGILVKGGGEAFQEASALDVIVFDKTGTLTEGGNPRVSNYDILVQGPQNKRLVWAIAQAMEESSSHPIAKAIVSLCQKQERANIFKADVEEVAGRGLQGTFTFKTESGEVEYEAVIGNESYMQLIGARVDAEWRVSVERWKTEGKSVALLAIKRVGSPTSGIGDECFVLAAQFATWDPLRPEATQVIKKLNESGISVWMISGDNVTTATAVGKMVGIPPENIIAGVLPDQKAEKVQWLQRTAPKRGMSPAKHKAALLATANQAMNENHSPHRAIVAMVGDGINDSPALTMSDVGIAIGSGSDVAIGSAKFVLVSSELTSLLTLTDLSRAVFRRVKFNFGWALIYNMCALPIAAGVLYPLKGHIRLNPIFASLAMACSSVSVICSSLLLRSRIPGVGFRPRKIDIPRSQDDPHFVENSDDEKEKEKTGKPERVTIRETAGSTGTISPDRPATPSGFITTADARPSTARTTTTATGRSIYVDAPSTPMEKQ